MTLWIPDAGIEAPMLAAGAVTAPTIADGAVTDGKVAGPIAAAKIEQGAGSGFDADTVDGKHASDFAGTGDVGSLQTTIVSLQATVASLQAAISALNSGNPGTFSGRVTHATLGTGTAGASVTLTPGPIDTTTDSTGNFSVSVAPGSYTAAFSATGFAAQSRQVVIAPNGSTQVVVALVPAGGVVVSAGPDVVITPGTDVTLQGTVSVFDAWDSIQGYTWRRLSDGGLISTQPSANVTAPYPGLASFVGSARPLAEILRHEIVGLTPSGLEQIRRSMDREYEFTVWMMSGAHFSDRVLVVAGDGPLQPTSGHRNVPRGVPVILGAPQQAAYAWSLTSKPATSNATIDRHTERVAMFTPDVPGDYAIAEDGAGTATLDLTAANWAGEGTTCAGCHSATSAAWAATPHAAVFTRNVDSGYPGESCLACHTAGRNAFAANGGFDDVAAAVGWTVPPPAPGNWFAVPPPLRGLANVRCEGCHGPGDNAAHVVGAAAEVSHSANACGTCHGQAEGHGRFEQWQASRHADLAPALQMGTVEESGTNAAHCGRCHSSQGFLAWVEQVLSRGNAGTIRKPDGSAADLAYLTGLGLTREEVQPVTCAACHEPHGNTVRLEDAAILLPAGFSASGLGRGTACALCHNSRNGLHEDAVPPSSYSSTHASAEADVLFGRNAYFMSSAAPRRPHTALADSCATCHAAEVPSPPGLGYQDPGKHHGFQDAYAGCSRCHPGLDGPALQDAVAAGLGSLDTALAGAAMDKLNDLGMVKVRAWDPLTDTYSSSSSDSNVTIDLAANPITSVEVLEIHGQVGIHFVLTSAISSPSRSSWRAGTSLCNWGASRMPPTAPCTRFPATSCRPAGTTCCCSPGNRRRTIRCGRRR